MTVSLRSLQATWMLLFGMLLTIHGVESFGVLPLKTSSFGVARSSKHPNFVARLPTKLSENSQQDSSRDNDFRTSSATAETSSSASDRAKMEEKIGNLVADDAWDGFGMELSDLITKAVVEDVKRQLRTFTSKEDLKIGDLSKEVDRRVKDTVAQMRSKDEYELFDLTLAMDELAKNYTEQLTGKKYEPGDLSKEIDRRIKAKAAEFCGKKSYEDYRFGDVTIEIDRRVRGTVEELISKPYEFGDISREIEKRRRQWVKDYLGEEAAANYKFGDITKKAIQDYTGKSEYQFGDLTKTLLKNVFGDRKKKN